MAGAKKYDPQYIAARRVLLNAYEALGSHREAVILVGAQAIYLHVDEDGLAVAPYTTDGDLALDPNKLADSPKLTEIFKKAGFKLTVRPGTWSMEEISIDFMVPDSLGGAGRRGARLGTHGSEFARKTTGLEAAFVDNVIFRIEALESTDKRSYQVCTAGVMALIIAKLYKINDRKDTLERLYNKDALDILRLLQHTPIKNHKNTLTKLLENPISSAATQQASAFLEAYFSKRDSLGVKMAIEATLGLENDETIAISCETLAQQLLNIWR